MNEKIRTTWELIDAVTEPLRNIASGVGGFVSRWGGHMAALAKLAAEGFGAGVREGQKYREEAARSTTETGRLESAVGKLGDRLGGLGEKLKSAFVNNVVAGAMGQVTAAIDKVKGAMIDGNAEFERYGVQFGVLLKDSEAAKQRLEELARFGAATPFELPEVVRADKILQAFGFHSEEAAKKFGMSGTEIRTVAGDVAAGTGASFEEISTYLGKFASGATGEAIMRFSELGITTRAELASMGLEFSKSGELVSPLDESMAVLLKSMEGKFGGMMEAQSSTFEGMTSNLNDWFGAAGRIIGQPLFEVLKDKLAGLLTFLNSPEAQAAMTNLAQGIATGVSTILEVVGNLSDAFAQEGIAGLIAEAVDTIGRAFGMTVDDAYDMGTSVFEAVQGIIAGVGQFVGFVSANLPTVIAIISQFAGEVSTWLNQHAKPAFDALVPVVEKVVGFIIANIPLVLSIIQPVFNTIGEIIGAVVVPAFEFMFETIAKVANFINENWPLIAPIITDVLNTIRSVVSNVLPPIRDFFVNTFERVKTFVETSINAILTIIRGVLKLLNGDTKGAMDDLRKGFEDGFNGVVEFLQKMPENFVRLGQGIIQGLYNGLMSKLKMVGDFFSKLGQDPVGAIQEALDMHSPSRVMFDLGQNTVQGYADGIAAGAGMVNRAILGVGGMAPAYANQAVAPAGATPGPARPIVKVYIGGREFAGAIIDDGAEALYSDMARRY